MKFPLAIRGNEVVRATQRFESRRQPQTLLQKVLDNSPSQFTNGGWQALESGNNQLVSDIQGEPIVNESVQLADWVIGESEPARCHQAFCAAGEYQFKQPKTASWTPLCQLISHAIKYSAEHELLLGDEVGLDVARSWVMVFTDGWAGDADPYLGDVQKAIALAGELRIDLFLIATGQSPDMSFLREIAQPGRPPVPAAGIESFKGLFVDLFQSLYAASQGRLGRSIELGGIELKLSR